MKACTLGPDPCRFSDRELHSNDAGQQHERHRCISVKPQTGVMGQRTFMRAVSKLCRKGLPQFDEQIPGPHGTARYVGRSCTPRWRITRHGKVCWFGIVSFILVVASTVDAGYVFSPCLLHGRTSFMPLPSTGRMFVQDLQLKGTVPDRDRKSAKCCSETGGPFHHPGDSSFQFDPLDSFTRKATMDGSLLLRVSVMFNGQIASSNLPSVSVCPHVGSSSLLRHTTLPPRTNLVLRPLVVSPRSILPIHRRTQGRRHRPR